MKPSGILPVQKNLYDRLRNFDTLMGKVVGIFDDIQGEQNLPYVSFGEITSTEYVTNVLKGEEIFQTLHIYGGTKTEIGEVIHEIEKALKEGFSIQNYDCHMCRIQAIEIFDKQNEDYFQGKIQIKLKITEVL